MTGLDNVQLSSCADKCKTIIENTLLWVCASQKTTIKNVCLLLNNEDESQSFFPLYVFMWGSVDGIPTLDLQQCSPK